MNVDAAKRIIDDSVKILPIMYMRDAAYAAAYAHEHRAKETREAARRFEMTLSDTPSEKDQQEFNALVDEAAACSVADTEAAKEVENHIARLRTITHSEKDGSRKAIRLASRRDRRTAARLLQKNAKDGRSAEDIATKIFAWQRTSTSEQAFALATALTKKVIDKLVELGLPRASIFTYAEYLVSRKGRTYKRSALRVDHEVKKEAREAL